MSKNIPIFEYPGGNQVSNLPLNTQYKWIDPLGGGSLSGPLPFGALRPDGIPAHGGVLTYNNTIPTVEYHGLSFMNQNQYMQNPYGQHRYF